MALLRPDAPRGGRAAPAHGGPHVRRGRRRVGGVAQHGEEPRAPHLREDGRQRQSRFAGKGVIGHLAPTGARGTAALGVPYVGRNGAATAGRCAHGAEGTCELSGQARSDEQGGEGHGGSAGRHRGGVARGRVRARRLRRPAVRHAFVDNRGVHGHMGRRGHRRRRAGAVRVR